MSADDILFSPITSTSSSVDILTRQNGFNNYDWKPVSDRAIAWAKTCWPKVYADAIQNQDGWMWNHSYHPYASVESDVEVRDFIFKGVP